MNCRSQHPSFWYQIRKPVLSVILALLCLALLIVYSPPSPFTESFIRLVKPALGYVGLCYAFRPFTPDPRPYDDTFSAVVGLSDGRSRTWVFPNMLDLKPGEISGHLKCLRASWHLHLWDCYCYRMSKDSELWKDAARYAARLYRNPDNPPILVSLYSEHRPISLPGTNGKEIESIGMTKTNFYKYSVQAEDLK